MNRRTFLGLAGSLVIADKLCPAAAPPIPIIDTHVHLFDPFRPQGVPWPTKEEPALYHTALPARYRPIAQPLGIVGAIAIECSSWPDDNQWVLDVAAKDDIMVGFMGHLVPGTPEFRAQLDHFHENPLFRGIRYQLGTPGAKELADPQFVADLKAIADAGLAMDTLNANAALLAEIVRITDQVPNLRIIIDHLPQMTPPSEPTARASYDASMKSLRERPKVYTKMSAVLRKVNGTIPTDLAFYKPRLDEIVDVFGYDRVLYGSNWPDSDKWLPVPEEFGLVHEYFMGKGQKAAEKFFWRNSVDAYKWVKRNASQRRL